MEPWIFGLPSNVVGRNLTVMFVSVGFGVRDDVISSGSILYTIGGTGYLAIPSGYTEAWLGPGEHNVTLNGLNTTLNMTDTSWVGVWSYPVDPAGGSSLPGGLQVAGTYYLFSILNPANVEWPIRVALNVSDVPEPTLLYYNKSINAYRPVAD